MDMWKIYDEHLDKHKDDITVEDAGLIYYFLSEVDKFGYYSSRIRCLLDCYMHFNKSAWHIIQELNYKGAFIDKGANNGRCSH